MAEIRAVPGTLPALIEARIAPLGSVVTTIGAGHSGLSDQIATGVQGFQPRPTTRTVSRTPTESGFTVSAPFRGAAAPSPPTSTAMVMLAVVREFAFDFAESVNQTRSPFTARF